ncbi:hypothetical protein E2C01_083172 [Portunus trituberculatus]|uniref:Uncharacterized protein n=1 Tax=Portunus trituberculatus TaxID=210409 RepID=A0A5B7J184_PORTR|nr:hypothetical protein [Portunus trituberculatus]
MRKPEEPASHEQQPRSQQARNSKQQANGHEKNKAVSREGSNPAEYTRQAASRVVNNQSGKDSSQP